MSEVAEKAPMKPPLAVLATRRLILVLLHPEATQRMGLYD
jgi:hypothetical protein